MNKINFQITGKCNMNCAFCCDAVSYQKESSLKDIKKMIERLPKNSIDEIHITGGEPLLYQNLQEVLEFIKEQGFRISLSTNGILLAQRKEILSFLDEIILPFDSSQEQTLKNMGRDEKQLINTLTNINIIEAVNPDLKITISTVLNKQNILEIEEILEIMQLLRFDCWQLHQFLPHGIGKRNIQNFLLDDREFQKIILYLETTDLGEKVLPLPVSEKVDTEWTITPNLQLVKLKDDHPALHGRLEEMSDRLLKDVFKRPKQYIKTNR